MTTEQEYQFTKRFWQKRQKKRKKHNNFSILVIISSFFIILPIANIILYKYLSPFELQYLNNAGFNADAAEIKPQRIGAVELIDRSNFNYLDQQAKNLNYTGDSITELASLFQKFVKTDSEKARIIYSWIAYHIDYDVNAYLSQNSGDISPNAVLKSRQTICSGYANLYQALAKEMGLQVVNIVGYVKGLDFVGGSTQDNHAWNGVKINGEWYLIDVTWGAGGIVTNRFVQNFDDFYFATEPDKFIYSHYPREQDWQLLTQVYSRDKFDDLPEVSPQFFKTGLELVNQKNGTIKVDDYQTEVIFKSPDDTDIVAQILVNGKSLSPDTIDLEKLGDNYILNLDFPDSGTYQLQIFAKHSDQELYYHAITYKVEV